MRAAYLRAHPLCEICTAAGRVSAAAELDHIVRRTARGSVWDQSNLQGLCKDCHSVKTISERGARVRPRIGLDGYAVVEQQRC